METVRKNVMDTPKGKVAYQRKTIGNFGECLVVRTSMKILGVYEFKCGQWKTGDGKKLTNKEMKELLKYGVNIA